VSRSLQSNKPVGVEFIAGNFGTYDGVNPTARLYTMHKEHQVPLEFSIYSFDIEKANALASTGEDPQMDHLFDFVRDFDLKDLSPSSHAALSESFLLSEQVA